MIVNAQHANMLISPARTLTGKVELYTGSTLTSTFTGNDVISKFTVNRAGDKKFFGFGILQSLELELLDNNRSITINKDQRLKTYMGVDSSYISPTPLFYISEVVRDENTNGLKVKAGDILHKANAHTISELSITAPYTIRELTESIASFLGLVVKLVNVPDTSFSTSYENGANYEGTETLRAVLDDIAEVTQTVYYTDYTNSLVLKRLDISGNPVLTIRKDDYFTLKVKDNAKLTTITHATELGDNVTVTTGEDGLTQYVRDNPFWDLRDDIDTLLNNAIAAIGGLSLNQFECSWRGNYLLEPADKIYLITKDNDVITSYLLDDKYTYNGGIVATTSWSYGFNESETESNAANLGDKLNQTFAKVDKVNKEIVLVTSDIKENAKSIAALQLDTGGISATVSSLTQSTAEEFDKVNDNIVDLYNEVNAVITPEDVQLQINSSLEKGITSVTTTTGFTFNDQGLSVSKSDSEMKTTISEDGMVVYKNNEIRLTANNHGVDAVNLSASTYLIIGKNSRFEDYDDNRTGCFWIG